MTSIKVGNKIGGVLLSASLIFSSCVAPYTAFNHSNDFRNVRSSVELTNDSRYSGYLTLSGDAGDAVLHNPERGESLSLPAGEIAVIKNDLGYFERKTLRGQQAEAHDQKTKTVFVKRLTDEDALVHVYAYSEAVANPKSALPNTLTRYYITIPGSAANEVWDLNGPMFNKGFNDKMKAWFAGDQRLVALIDQKDPQYYYRNFSLRSNDKVNIIMNLNRGYHPGTASYPVAN